MKAYGFTRRDKRSCAYGCCTFRGSKKCKVTDRARRKRARREAKIEAGQD